MNEMHDVSDTLSSEGVIMPDQGKPCEPPGENLQPTSPHNYFCIPTSLPDESCWLHGNLRAVVAVLNENPELNAESFAKYFYSLSTELDFADSELLPIEFQDFRLFALTLEFLKEFLTVTVDFDKNLQTIVESLQHDLHISREIGVEMENCRIITKDKLPDASIVNQFRNRVSHSMEKLILQHSVNPIADLSKVELAHKLLSDHIKKYCHQLHQALSEIDHQDKNLHEIKVCTWRQQFLEASPMTQFNLHHVDKSEALLAFQKIRGTILQEIANHCCIKKFIVRELHSIDRIQSILENADYMMKKNQVTYLAMVMQSKQGHDEALHQAFSFLQEQPFRSF